MASLLKKTFAVVLAIGLVISCFTVSAADVAPSIDMTTGYVNYGTAGDVSVRISTENFDVIYGSQFTITIPEGFTFVSIANNGGVMWIKGSNYVVDENNKVITFLDVRTDKGFDITLTMDYSGSAAPVNPIVLTPEMFIDSNEAEYSNVTIEVGSVNVTNTILPENETPKSVPGYFIPYGSVTYFDGNPVAKGDNGEFESGTTVSYFKLPEKEVGVTTFGVSEKTQEDVYVQEDGTEVKVPAGIQFGSYALDVKGKEVGTLVVMGELADFRAKFSDMTDEAFFNKLMGYCDQYLTGADAGKKIKLTEDGVEIRIGRVKRTTYMWKGTAGEVEGHRQYALRVTTPVADTRYSAIGYSKVNNAYTYSENVQSVIYKGSEQ